MVKSYCVKQKKVTECVPGSERYQKTKNGRTIMKCTCAECGITKTKFVKSQKVGGDVVTPILDKAGTPGKVAEKSMSIVETLIPSTKHVFDRYKSGDIAKSAFSTDTGVLSKQFWTGKSSNKTLMQYKDLPCDSVIKVGKKYVNTPECSGYERIGWNTPTYSEYKKGLKGRPR